MEHKDEFIRLPDDKQEAIINSAMRVFAASGYKKAYISEIASEAGISKALVFYYFGTKKALYFYLVDYAYNLIMTELKNSQISKTDDFFDRIKMIASVELSLMKKHAFITRFINSMYFETDKEVTGDLQTLFAGGGATRENLALDGVDLTRFKAGVDPKLVVTILVKFTEGVVNSRTSAQSFEESLDEFENCLELLKNNLYKEELLS